VADGAIKRRDYTHVFDVVGANLLALEKDIPSAEVINIGKGKNYSVLEVAGLIGGPTEVIPARKGEYLITVADNSKARQLLGWEPKISLEQGIEDLKKSYGLA